MNTDLQLQLALASADCAPAPGSAYPHLTHMSTDDLAMMLRQVSQYPEDAEFAKAVAKEIARRKPSPGMPNNQ